MSTPNYHNPNCGTSGNAFAIFRRSGEEPVIIEYLRS
jgi:arsenate reductase